EGRGVVAAARAACLPGLGADAWLARGGHARLRRCCGIGLAVDGRDALSRSSPSLGILRGGDACGRCRVDEAAGTSLGGSARVGQIRNRLNLLNWKDRASMTVPRLAIVAHDVAMVWLCWAALHHFRYALLPVLQAPPISGGEILLVLVAQGAVFWQVGLYRGVWRFASLPDLVNILKAAMIGLL